MKTFPILKESAENRDNVEENKGSPSEKKQKGKRNEKIGISFLIYSIRDLNTGDSTFSADLGLFLNWFDQSVVSEPEQKSEKELIDSIKTPPFKMVNAISEEIYRENIRLVDKSKGEINNFQCRRGVFHNNYNLRRFPFDSQTLCFFVKSNRTLEESNYQSEYGKSYKHETYYNNECDKITGWRLDPSKCTQHLLYFNNSSFYVISMHYDRTTLFFLMNVFFPIFVLILLDFSCYAIELSDYNSRLNVSLIVLLTLAAFRFSLSDSLPKLGYLTVFDIYDFSGLMFILVECIFNFLISLYVSDYDSSELRHVDYIFHLIIFATWILWTFGFIGYHAICKEVKDAQKHILEELDDQKIYPSPMCILQKEEIKTLLDQKV